MTRFILFDGAPTVAQCYSSIDAVAGPAGAWHTFTIELSPSPRPHQSTGRSPDLASNYDSPEPPTRSQGTEKRRRSSGEPDVHAWDVTTSRFDDALESAEEGDLPEKAAVIPSSQADPDSLEMARRRRRRRSSSSPGFEGHHEGPSRTSFMLPPPTQPRARTSAAFRVQHSQPAVQPPHDVSFPFLPTAPLPDQSRAMTSCTADDSYDSTFAGGISIGPPPLFVWHLHHLTPLNELRKKLAWSRASRAPPEKVAVLAVVNSLEQRDTSAGSVTEVTLLDETGQHVKLVAWKEAGDEIAKAIRRADIIYFEKLTISEYNGALQLKFRDSMFGIYWRTHIIDERDEWYRFHPGWRHTLIEADRVLQLAEWFARRCG